MLKVWLYLFVWYCTRKLFKKKNILTCVRVTTSVTWSSSKGNLTWRAPTGQWQIILSPGLDWAHSIHLGPSSVCKISPPIPPSNKCLRPCVCNPPLVIELFPSLHLMAEIPGGPPGVWARRGRDEWTESREGEGEGRRRGEEGFFFCVRGEWGLVPVVNWPGGHPQTKSPANNTPGLIRLNPTRVWI